MKRITVSVAFVLGICFLAASANGQDGKLPSDADIAKLLVGKWRFESGPDDPPMKITFSFAKDQTSTMEVESVDVKGARHQIKGEATWKIDKGDIVTTITKAADPKEVGKVERSKLVSIDASAFKMVVVFKSDDNKKEFKEEFEFKRVK